MTWDLRALPAAPIAALLFGAAGTTALLAVSEGIATLLVAVVVAIVGVAVAAIPAVRGAGVGLTVLGAHLVGVAVVAVAGVAPILYALAYGLPMIAMVVFAVRGVLACATGAGLLLPVVVLIGATSGTVAVADTTSLAVGMLVGAVVLTVVVVVAPDRAWWGHLAGAAAATSATVAFGMGGSPVEALITFRWPAVATPAGQIAIMTGALAVAAVLVMVAAIRRDVVTGLVAATVFAAPVLDAVTGAVTGRPAPAPTHIAMAVPLAVVIVVAVLAVRLYPLRGWLAEAPGALRGRTPTSATTAAAAAAVVACALVAFTVQALPALGVGGSPQGAMILAALLVAGALAHFLPAPAGAATAVVTLVGFAVTWPWARLVASPGVTVLVEVATTVVVVGVLVRRHPQPAVFAAAAYLVIGTLARLLGYAGAWPFAVLVLPLLLVGLPAALLAWQERTARVALAVGAVVLGAAMYLPMKLFLIAYVDGETFDPFVPTDAVATAVDVREFGWRVVLVLGLLALVLVASVVRRPSTALVVTAALLVYCASRVSGSLVTELAVLAWVLGALAVASAVLAWSTIRRA
jgi:hypothetical protein